MGVGNLKNKTAWITGGKRIGREIAEALAELGANIVVSYRSSKKEAEEVIERAAKHDVKTLMVQADMASKESVKGVVREIKSAFGSLDILILMASIFQPVKLEQIEEADWEKNFSVHIKGTFWPIQLSLPLMKPGSHIITISDRTAIGRIYPGYLPYTVTKGAIAQMTRALGVELGPKGIFINAIAPGPVLKPDDISAGDWQSIRESSMIKYPISDDQAVQEFADTAVRLCFVRSSGGVYPLDLGHI